MYTILSDEVKVKSKRRVKVFQRKYTPLTFYYIQKRQLYFFGPAFAATKIPLRGALAKLLLFIRSTVQYLSLFGHLIHGAAKDHKAPFKGRINLLSNLTVQ